MSEPTTTPCPLCGCWRFWTVSGGRSAQQCAKCGEVELEADVIASEPRWRYAGTASDGTEFYRNLDNGAVREI